MLKKEMLNHLNDVEQYYMLKSCLDHSIKEAWDWYVCIAL